MGLDLLAGYDSNAGSDDSSDAVSSERSIDSAELRAAAAEARLRDYGDGGGATSRPQPGVLPSALAALSKVSGPPSFLDPDATRPLATAAQHTAEPAAGDGDAAAAAGGKRSKQLPGPGFDISTLAPPMKGQQQQGDKRGPAGAVIEAKAKRYKVEDGPEATQQYTATQVALMGGKTGGASDGDALGDGGGADARGKPSRAMGVDAFLDKGVGGALLPRKQQDRKNKEQKKRALGQSAIGSWKTEAEMVLRQQYDS